MATLTTLAGLPALANLRYRAHSRTCTFQAMSLIGCGRLSLRLRIWPRKINPAAGQPPSNRPRRSRSSPSPTKTVPIPQYRR
jgi:hypothetical protein